MTDAAGNGRHGDLVFDVGLHRGEDTAFYLTMGYRVVAFEANPDLVRRCRARFALELQQGRLVIVEGAVHATPARTVTFYQHPLSAWGTTEDEWVRRNRALGESRMLTVPTVDFSAALRAHGVPYYLKIDIEGSDIVCLQALRHSSVRPMFVSLESAKRRFSDLVAEFDLLESLGYRRFAVVQQAGIPAHPATTTRLDGTSIPYTFEPDASGAFGADLGPWMTRETALAAYRRIFRQYRLLGDDSMFQATVGGRMLRAQLEKRLKRPLPGWYDTHASLSTSGGVEPRRRDR